MPFGASIWIARLAVSPLLGGLDGFWWVLGRLSWWCVVHGVPVAPLYVLVVRSIGCYQTAVRGDWSCAVRGQDVADWSCAVHRLDVAAALLSLGASRGLLAAAPMPFIDERRDASRWCNHCARALSATRWTAVFLTRRVVLSCGKLFITIEMVNSDTLDLTNDCLL